MYEIIKDSERFILCDELILVKYISLLNKPRQKVLLLEMMLLNPLEMLIFIGSTGQIE